MTLYVANPSAIMENRRRMMRRLIEESFNSERVMTFPVELSETNEEYTLKALLPGLSSEAINIQFSNGTLTIEGEYPAGAEDKVQPVIDELPVGRFNRSFELADSIMADKIEANMHDGVLTLRIPKAEEAKPRTIKIVAR